MKNKHLICSIAFVLVMSLLIAWAPGVYALTTVEQISVSGLTAPQPGEKPDYSASADAFGYSVWALTENEYHNGVAWYDVDLMRYMQPDEAFVDGHSYISYVLVQPDVGYELAPVICTVDSKTAEAAIRGDHVALISNYGVCGSAVIDRVSVTGLQTPVAGQPASYTATAATKGYTMAGAETNYSKNGILWYDATQEHNLATTGTFHEDHVYIAYITVKAEDGYRFATFAEVDGSINGYTAEVQGGMEQDELVLALEFAPCVSAEDSLISEVTIFNVEAPVAGAQPLYLANVMPTVCELVDLDAENTLHGICWYDDTVQRELGISDRFIGGHTYTLILYLQTVPGYNLDPNAEYKVNGELASGIGAGGFATVTAEFVCEGAAFTDVDLNAFYYVPMIWAVQEKITTGTSDTTFSPNDPCTRGQAVTFLWRSAGSPEPAAIDCPFTDVSKDAYYYKAMMWAVGSKITTGTSKTTFSPNDPCTRGQIVTFMWRAWGSPEPMIQNSFTDVPSLAYYRSAVVWAVDREITKGTSDTTFSPDDLCTRGQIVTFLYRSLN